VSIFGALFLMLAAGTASADILRVPVGFERVGDALAAAAPSDTVLVAPGSYVENLIWPDTPGIKLLSEAGAAVTVLDGGAQESVIGIYTGVDTTTVVRGFTIRNGYVHGM
jgi:hypothetical protein